MYLAILKQIIARTYFLNHVTYIIKHRVSVVSEALNVKFTG